MKISTLSDVEQDGIVKVILPDGICDSLMFRVKRTRYTDDSNYTWFGTVNNDKDSSFCAEGYISLISRNNRNFGYITLDSTMYELYELSEGYNILVKLKPSSGTIEECGMRYDSTSNSPVLVEKSSLCPIDVLILYNQSTLDNLNGDVDAVTDLAAIGIQQTNDAMLNSDIGENETMINLVGVAPTTFNSNPLEQAEENVVLLATNLDATTLRDQFAADLVILIDGAGLWDALGISGTNFLEEDLSYAIVNMDMIQAAPSLIIFTHELGHLLGCEHEQGEQSSSESQDGVNHAHKLNFCLKKRKTLVYSGPNSTKAQRILHFSNPDVNYKGKPTGTATSNNATAIKMNACTVSEYKNSLTSEALNIGIFGGTQLVCIGEQNYYFANISGGVNPFTYAWYLSNNGISWGSAVSTSDQLTVTALAPAGTVRHVKLEVTDINGVVDFAYREFESTSDFEHCALLLQAPPHDEQGINENGYVFKSYPNPVIGELNILLFQPEASSKTIIELYNLVGTKVMTLHNAALQQGMNVLSYDVSTLPAGMYQCRWQVEDRRFKTSNIFITQ